MNIDYIESFLETAKLKSMSKASEMLHITHPALSKQIRSVEKYFGATLFLRSAAGVALTEAGRTLQERLQPIFAELAAIRLELADFRTLEKITLGTLPSLAAHYIPEAAFALEQRKVRITLAVSPTSQELYDQLKAGTLDAAVMEYDRKDSMLWTTRLFSESYYAVVYPNHPLANTKSISLTQLTGEPLIVHPPACQIRRTVTQGLSKLGIEPVLKAEVPFGEYILGYVAAGAGIAIVPGIAAGRLANPALCAIPIKDEDACRTISLVSSNADIGELLESEFKSLRPQRT